MPILVYPLFIVSLIVGLTPARAARALSLNELRTKYPARHFAEVDLPSGRTHFQAVGRGDPVILVHGVSGPLAVWDKNFGVIHRAGYLAVRYDLLGRGFSERKTGVAHSLDLYVHQLEELIAELKLADRPIRIVGSSFGAIIAAEFAIRHPDLVAGLVLIGPAGFPIHRPWTAKLRDVPVLGGLLTRLLSHRTILKQNDRYFIDETMPEDLRPFVSDHLAVPGTTQAILSTMDHAPVQSYVESYRKLGALDIPVGVIWGWLDATFPYENAVTFLKFVPHAELVTVDLAGHLPQYERSQVVNPDLIELLGSF